MILNSKEIKNIIEGNQVFHALKEKNQSKWISIWMEVINNALKEPLKILGIKITKTPISLKLSGIILDSKVDGTLTFDDAAELFSLKVINIDKNPALSQEVYKRFIKILEHFKLPCEFKQGKLLFRPRGLPAPKEINSAYTLFIKEQFKYERIEEPINEIISSLLPIDENLAKDCLKAAIENDTPFLENLDDIAHREFGIHLTDKQIQDIIRLLNKEDITEFNAKEQIEKIKEITISYVYEKVFGIKESKEQKK